MQIFNNAVIIITGAASGVGKELSTQLAAQNAKLILCDTQQDKLDELAAQITQSGGIADSLITDVSNASQVENAVQFAVKKYNSIDYVFNNAGIAVLGEMQDIDLHHWKKTIDVNLMGVVYGSSIAYKQMAKQKKGHIVNTASLGGLCAVPLAIPYATSKHGVVGLSRSLREEGRAFNIKVSVICPGYIDTPIFESTKLINTGTTDIRSSIPIKTISAQKAASIILKGVVKNKAVIVFPFYAKIFRFIHNNFSFLTTSVHQKAIKDFRKKKEL